MGIKHTKVSAIADAADTALVRPSDWNTDHTIDGDVDFNGHDATVGFEAYSSGWAGDLTVPTKSAIHAKIESMPGGSATVPLSDIWVDIRDYGDISSGNITAALQATIDAIGTAGLTKTIMIPQATGVDPMTQDEITVPTPTVSPGWTFIYACKRILLTATMNLPGSTTIKGWPGNSLYGQRTGAFGPDGAHFISSGAAMDGEPMILLDHVGTCEFENIALESAGIALRVFHSPGLLCKDCLFSGAFSPHGIPLEQPAVILDGQFWSAFYNCKFQSYNGSACLEVVSTEVGSDVGGGLISMENIVTHGGPPFKFGPILNGPNSGSFYVTDCISEDMPAGSSLFELHDGAGMHFTRCSGADPLGTVYLVAAKTARIKDVIFEDCGGLTMDPTSFTIPGLQIKGGQGGGSSYEEEQFVPTHNPHYRIDWPEAIDARLVAAPRGPQMVVGTVMDVNQDSSSWVNQGADSKTTGHLAPDGSLNAVEIVASAHNAGYLMWSENRNLAVGDWYIAGCWAQKTDANEQPYNDQIDFHIGYGAGTLGTEGGSVHIECRETSLWDTGWKWHCGCRKVLTLGSGGNPAGVTFMTRTGDRTIRYFNPSVQFIPVSLGMTDADVLNVMRSYRGGWPPTAVAGDSSILDHQALRAGSFKAVAKTFATLPSSPVAGQQGYITDSNTVVWGANAAGGGANKVAVWYNGTNWTVMGK